MYQNNNPFGLSCEVKWLIEVIAPMLIVFLGWLIIYFINNSKQKKDLIVTARITAYENLQHNLNNTIKASESVLSFLISEEKKIYEFSNDYTNYGDKSMKFLDLKIALNTEIQNLCSKWLTYDILYNSIPDIRVILIFYSNTSTIAFHKFFKQYVLFLENIKSDKNNIEYTPNTLTIESFINIIEEYTLIENIIKDVAYEFQRITFNDIIKINKKHLDENINKLEQVIIPNPIIK